MIEKCIKIAEDLHKDQKRKYTGLPYVSHTQRVAQIYQTHFPNDELGICVAHLHDTVEDCGITFADLYDLLNPEKLLIDYSAMEIVRGVEALTDVYTSENYPSMNRRDRKFEERQRLAGIDVRWKNIKICDMIDNCEDIVRNDKEFARTYLKEKHEILQRFKDADPILWKAADSLIDWGMFRVVLGD